jgi:hypothetical protein
MKFKNVHCLNESQKLEIKRILGVRNKFPMVLAFLQGTNDWNILRGLNNEPLDAEKRLKHVATFFNVGDVLAYFQRMDLTPFCPASDINHDNPGTERAREQSKKEMLHRRHQFRKNVSLEGRAFHKGAMESHEVLITDLSFNGAGFYTIGPSLIRKEDILSLDFTLNNKKQSRIERNIEVKHVAGRKVGGEFLYKPRLDADLGFYLMFDVK